MHAIILAGGKGERLSPFTSNCPKGMIKIEGKPILEYQLEWLKKYKVTSIVIACGHLNNMIRDYFGNGSKYSLEITYSIEKEPLGRGGAIKKAWGQISSRDPVLVLNGDIYTEMDLSKVINAHKEQTGEENIIATICLFPYKSPYGIIKVNNDGLVESFEEKRALPYWVNGGIYIFEPEIRSYLPDQGDHETSTFPELAKKKLIYGYKSLDYWKGIDTVKDLNEFIYEKKMMSVS